MRPAEANYWRLASLARRVGCRSRWKCLDHRLQLLDSLAEVSVEAPACATSRRRQEDPVSYIDVERSIFDDERRQRHNDERLRLRALLCGGLAEPELERPCECGLENESWRGWRFLSSPGRPDCRRDLRIELLV